MLVIHKYFHKKEVLAIEDFFFIVAKILKLEVRSLIICD